MIRCPLRYGIVAWALLNAWLYSGLLPLWEGFDEPFHYGYVETLTTTHRLPVMGVTLLPGDVTRSFRIVPASHVVKKNLPQVITFDDWFALSTEEKARRRQMLSERASVAEPAGPNYEAHQPPLAYLVLSVFETTLLHASLPGRILGLRLFGASCSVLLLAWGMMSLLKTLRMRERFANAALFAVFSSQMLYATIAHVANDWLALPVATMLFASFANLAEDPSKGKRLWVTALSVTVGILTKAYFLVFIPVWIAILAFSTVKKRIFATKPFFASLAVFALACFWYLRNILLYGNVTGTQEAFNGIGIPQILAVFPQMDWLAAARFNAHAFLWTGNNSSTSFSTTTLNLTLLLLAGALVMWTLRPKAMQLSERALLASVIAFLAALVYAAAASYAQSGGASVGASPWYSQVILVPIVALAMLGMSRARRIGRMVASATVVMWSYILVVTWTVKLFPMYSGAGDPPMRLTTIWNWYAHQAVAHRNDLSQTALAPALLLYTGLLIDIVVTIWLAILVLRPMIKLKTRYTEEAPQV